MSELQEKRDRLLAFIGRYDSCVVAFSAGVDSSVVSKAAQLVLGDKAVAATGISASDAEGKLEKARELAQVIGIRHEVVPTCEFDNPDFVRNDPDRCYHCKVELFTRFGELRERLGMAVVFDGSNAEDQGDYRPGMRAVAECSVVSPLAECGFAKPDIRGLAAEWELPNWNSPATTCLATRVAYGLEVTPERLAMIDRAEQFLHAAGMAPLRVRYHEGEMARVEVPLEALPRLCEDDFRRRLVEHLKKQGFKYVTLDLEGFRSGSQNIVLSVAAADEQDADG